MFEDFLNLFLQGVTLPQQLHTTGKTIRMRVIAIFHLLLLTAAEMGAGNRMDQPYLFYQLDRTCLPYKKEVNMGTGAAIFYLDESELRTREYLAKRELNCHMELQVSTSKLFGFHVFIDELQLDENTIKPASRSLGHCPNDYVQFGRDTFYVTTSTSGRYCGTMEKVHFHNTSAAVRSAKLGRKGTTRWYIEKNDFEMDLWVKVKQNRDSNRGLPGHKPFRKIRIIVTVFRKNCKNDTDFWYRKCKGSNYCIRDTYFCDTLPNCVWPSGEDAADEKECRSGDWKPSPLSRDKGERSMRGGGSGVPSIPIIIIIIIVIVIGVVGIALVARNVITKLKWRRRRSRSRSSRQTTPSSSGSSSHRHRGSSAQMGMADSAALINTGPNPVVDPDPSAPSPEEPGEGGGLGYPMTPPTYDEATKNSVGPIINSDAVRTIIPDDPPPYQP